MLQSANYKSSSLNHSVSNAACSPITTPRRTALGFLFGVITLVMLPSAQAADVLRVMVHDSFSLPKPLLAQFEKENKLKLQVIKGGDAGEMLNKLILTRGKPIADVVFGIDNSLAAKANQAGVLEAYTGPAAAANSVVQVGANLIPVDYGYVTINVDKVAFSKTGLPLPKDLKDLTQAAYKNMLVVQNPSTSSTGYAFLLATIGGLGEAGAFEWWKKMRQNGLKVAKGWSDAYYSDFSKNGGRYPLVVSYSSSPAAEVFYSKEKLTTPPTDSLVMTGGVWQQVEGVALIKGGGNVTAAGKWIEFLRSDAVQRALQTNMWMAPVNPDTVRDPVFNLAPEPKRFDRLSSEEIAAKGAQWVAQFNKIVLR
jgi:thiamine transport system substrate-binding protein